ncbi:MAG: sensor histidine kinase [Marvinbryantia sp.]|uniref:sensor histidine kinase n=1 Tax=Marvinbryantia sp. TaxID=2496532 RepID=UPI00399B459D
MTVKKRLFWSNILMILVPVIATVLIGVLCMGFIWFALIHGMGIGIHDQDEFEVACTAISEGVKESLENGSDFSSIQAILEKNQLTLRVDSETESVYTYGEEESDDSALYAAADLLDNQATIAKNGRMLYARQITADGISYTIYLTGGYYNTRSYADLKTAVVLAAILILFTIFASILFTNRFLTKFVWKRIEEPLDILVNGVHELRDGNLDYRITYERQDEFLPVCQDFNEMAGRLKEMVQRIQQQERSRKELIAGISHDIRTPLTSIQAYVEGLLDGIAKTPEAERRYLETIKTKAKDLDHIVSQLFLFSKMELGEYPKDLRELRLNEVMEDIVLPRQEEYRQKGLSITMDLEEVSLKADPVQFQRITTNILENSLKYKVKEQGNLQISLHRKESGFYLSFADDGPGVPEESLPHLFEVFYRSDPSRQNPHQGSGLGLAIVAAAAEQMGGSIRALPSRMGGLEIQIEFEGKEEA